MNWWLVSSSKQCIDRLVGSGINTSGDGIVFLCSSSSPLLLLSFSSPPPLLLLSSFSPPPLLFLSFSSPSPLLLSFSSPPPLLLLSFSSPPLLLLSFSSPSPLLLLSSSFPPPLLLLSFSSPPLFPLLLLFFFLSVYKLFIAPYLSHAHIRYSSVCCARPVTQSCYCEDLATFLWLLRYEPGTTCMLVCVLHQCCMFV